MLVAVMEPYIVRRKRILLVDDEPGARKALSLFLSIDQHTVTEAEDGKEACLLYTPGDYDLVITDYDMPRMKGDELTRTIKCLVPSQPVIMVTGLPGELWGQDNPVDALLIKPITISELRQAIAMVISEEFLKLPTRPARTGAAPGSDIRLGYA
jgi:CheY-like chemotaxis protein